MAQPRVQQCEVCKRQNRYNPGLTFHSFPKDLEKRKIWFSLLNFNEQKIIKRKHVICSEHFDVNDFFYYTNGVKRLKADSFPKQIDELTYQESQISDKPVKCAESREPLKAVFVKNEPVDQMDVKSADNTADPCHPPKETELVSIKLEREFVSIKLEREPVSIKLESDLHELEANDDFEESWSESLSHCALKEPINFLPIKLGNDLKNEIEVDSDDSPVRKWLDSINPSPASYSTISTPTVLCVKTGNFVPTEIGDTSPTFVESECSDSESTVTLSCPELDIDELPQHDINRAPELVIDKPPELVIDKPPELVIYKPPELSTDVSPNAILQNHVNKRKRKCFVGDLSTDDFSSPEEAIKNFMILKETIGSQKKKIKFLQQKVRVLSKKITKLKSSLKLYKIKK